ncbi:MAG: hypothetical protein JO112_06355 [Planctomycetes bacterium]|nr:hypothetical protein [Planctomycetota bacterium]
MPDKPDDFGTLKVDLNQLKSPNQEKPKRKQPAPPGKTPHAKPSEQVRKVLEAVQKPAEPAQAKSPAHPPTRPSALAGIKASEAAKLVPLSEEAKKLLQDDLTVLPYLELLMQNHLFQDGVHFLAHALPKREAIRWALECARGVVEPEPPAAVAQAFKVVEKWIQNPSEEHRRAALASAETVGVGTPAGCTAMAAFWSAGSLSPPNLPVVPPPENLTGRGVANAVLLAGLVFHPEKADDNFHQFLTLGIEKMTR